MLYAVYLALIAGVGAILLQWLPKYKWLVAIVLLAILTPLTLVGFGLADRQWGISDWDYYFSLHTDWRNTILTYHQLPLWNPYTCGGTAALGDPEFSVFTPSFLFELAFGVPTGLRLAIYFMTFLGGAGMIMLARRLGFSAAAGFLVGIIYAFGSVNLLEIVEGHPNIFSAGWIPWVFWAWLWAYETSGWRDGIPDPRSIKHSDATAAAESGGIPRVTGPAVVLAIFLSLTFYQGGIYLLMYTALAFLLLPWLTKRPWQAYKTTAVAGVIALGLSGFKLLPVFWWLREFQDQAYASSAYTLPWLYQILAGRYLHGAEVIPDQGGGWHEYGAYVGLPVLILAFIGAWRLVKNRVVRALVIATLLGLLLSSLGPVLKPFFDHLDFFPRSNISRFILFAVIPITLLAGSCLTVITNRWPRISRLLIPVVVAVVALDLTSLAYDLSHQAFILPPVIPAVSPAPSPIAFTTRDFKIREAKNKTQQEDYTRAYAATLAGYGTMSYCSVLTPEAAVKLVTDPGGANAVDSSNDAAKITLEQWSPNKIIAQVDTPTQAQIMLNTNYAKGWHVNDQIGKEMGGRVGILVQPGQQTLTFRYWSPGLTAGAIVTIITSISLLGMYIWQRRHSHAG